MVGKSFLSIVVALFILLAFQPYIQLCDVNKADTRDEIYEIFTMEKLPPKDGEGNYTLDDEGWKITGEGVLDANITLYGISYIEMINANITVNGTIWARDNTEIRINSSILRLEIPSPEFVLVEEQYFKPNGFLLIEDSASLTIMDSSIYLYRHDVENLSEEDPPGMMKPDEVFVNFGRFIINASYLNTSSLKTEISPWGTSNHTFPRGIVMHMDCELDIIDSNLISGIVFYVNSHGLIHNTTFKSISMQKNTEESIVTISNSTIIDTVTIDEFSNAVFRDSYLKSVLIVKGWTTVFLHNTTINGLKMEGNGTLIMNHSDFSAEPPLLLEWNHIKDNSNLTLLNSTFINNLFLYENSSVSLVNSSINKTYLYENGVAFLKDSVMDYLTAEGNSTVLLQGSEIKKYNLSGNAKICNITTLSVGTILNLQPLQISVELKDSLGKPLISLDTNDQGKAVCTLIRDMIFLNKTTMDVEFSSLLTSCTVVADHENLHKEKVVEVNDDYVEVELEFEDYSAPLIREVSFDVDSFLNTNENVLVSVHVEDLETNLADVTLKYSVDDGTSWENITLYNTGEDMYENSIPGQSDGKKVRFYIIAEDNCGNTAESRYYSYTVGEDVIMVNNLIVITAIILVIGFVVLMTVRVLLGKRKIKKYLHSDGK